MVRYLREYRTDKPLFTAPCNGIDSTAWAKRKAKEAGLSNGVPDLLIFEPRGPFVGLAIEMKRPGCGTMSQTQWEWHAALQDRDWHAVVCYGAEEAIATVRQYLDTKSKAVESRD